MKATFYVLGMAGFVSGANMRIFDSLLPVMAEEYGVLATTASVVVTAFVLAYGICQLGFGPLADRVGKIKIVLIASLIASLASLGSSYSLTLSEMVFWRFLTGVGSAAIIPLAIAWIGDNTPYAARQAILARFLGVVVLGSISGPIITGFLAELVSWQSVFYLFSGLFFVVAILMFLVYKTQDFVSGLERRPNVVQEYKRVLRDPWVRIMLFTLAAEGALFYGAFTFTGNFLKEKFELPLTTVGIVMSSFGIGGVIYSLMVRRLLGFFGERGLVSAGGAIIMLCYLVLPVVDRWIFIVPVLCFSGIGFYMFHNTLQTRSTEMAPRSRGTALALHAFSIFLGSALGVSLCGMLILAIGYQITYMLCGILLFILGLWFRRSIVKKDNSKSIECLRN